MKHPKPPIPLWQAIVLAILGAFGLIGLFAAMLYLLLVGTNASTPLMIALFVLISGVFAWLLKRLTDIVSGMSQHWFPEEEPLETEESQR